MPCADTESRLQAYFDGELGALDAAAFEAHLETCAECRAALESLRAMRSALRMQLPDEPAPPALAARISAALDRESGAIAPGAIAPGATAPQPAADDSLDALAALSALTSLASRGRGRGRDRAGDGAAVGGLQRTPRGRSFGVGVLAGAGGTLLAAALAIFVILPRTSVPRAVLLDDLVNAHVRSLMPAHLVDVESTDRHTVKPWFAGHVDVSPAVYDFSAQGYRLVGGRADYFEHQRAAALVYQHGAHLINVFSWAGEIPVPADTTRNGYHLAFWQDGNLHYCAVSDTGWSELVKLESLIRTAERGDSHG